MSYDEQFYDDRQRAAAHRPPPPPVGPPAGAPPHGSYPPPVPPRRRRHYGRWIVGGLIALVVIGIIGAGTATPRSPIPSGPPVAVSGPSGMTSVGPVPANGNSDSMNVDEDTTATADTNTRYSVTGSGRADITYATDQGMEQRLDQPLPFYVDVNVTMASITAQRKSSRAGEVVCAIEARGEQIARTTGQGAYAICAASGI